MSLEDAKNWIKGDGFLWRLDEFKKGLEETLKRNVDDISVLIKKRKAEIIMQSGVAYENSIKIEDKFPNKINVKRGFQYRINTIEITDSDGKKYSYYRHLGIWIEGEPEKKGDDLYCRITGEKISR